MVRLCIYPKQIADIEHISERQAQRILQTIRKELNKKKNQAVTVQEFSDYKGYNVADVLRALR